MNKIDIYTDGAASIKTQCGGWSYVVINDDNIVTSDSSGNSNTTNNQMELTAFLKALEYIKENNIEGNIYSDSAYVVNCLQDKWYVRWLNNGWKSADKTPVKNQDLWKKILNLYFELEDKIKVYKVKGHSGIKWNEYVDLLAKKQKQIYELKAGF